jgi:hypothetical protein
MPIYQDPDPPHWLYPLQVDSEQLVVLVNLMNFTIYYRKYFQLLFYSKCTMYTTIRHELHHARKTWPGTLVEPCLLSDWD